MSAVSTQAVLRNLWLGAGLPASYLDTASVTLTDAGRHVIPSSFRIGCAAQASIAASALAASLHHSLTKGGPVEAHVDARHAVLEFASERYSRLANLSHSKSDSVHASAPEFKELLGLPADMPADWDPLAGYYECAKGRYVRLHTNWRHHKLGLLGILGLSESANRDDVALALSTWEAEQFESAAIRQGMCATMCRTADEWKATEMHKAIQKSLDSNGGCPVKVMKMEGSASPGTATSPRHSRPSLRIIDMSRVIAAPVAARTLTKHGADVLLVSSPHLPRLPMVEIDTARGKRTAEVDLNTNQGREKLIDLVKGADVLLQAYRPGSLAAKGFAKHELQHVRPGLVYAELCAYGFDGPWKKIRGFDSLVQSACGLNSSEAESYRDYRSSQIPGGNKEPCSPRVLPCQALDHASGYLLTFGILAAKCRSLLEDGDGRSGWHVQVSLAGVAAWLESLGRVHGREAWQIPSPIEVEGAEVLDLLEPYAVRGAGQPLTLYAMQHAARNLPRASGNHISSVPARLDADELEWV